MALLAAMCQETADPRRARQFALLLGEGAKYPRLMARYVETVLEPRREVIREVLRRGIAAGELRPDLDVNAALFMLTGAVVVRRGHEQSAIPPDYPERIVDELLRGSPPADPPPASGPVRPGPELRASDCVSQAHLGA